MNTDQHKYIDKFDFWKKPVKVDRDPKETHMSYFQQTLAYWTLLGLLSIITINLMSPVGTKTHLYKAEMTQVLYDDDDAMTRLLRDEKTTTTKGEKK